MTRYPDTDSLPDDLATLDVGDRLGQVAVARTPEQFNDDGPRSRLVLISTLKTLDDTHSALAAAPDPELLFRIRCRPEVVAHSEAEHDWTIREIGRGVTIDQAAMDYDATGRDPDPQQETVADWAATVIMARSGDPGRHADELYLTDGTRFEIYDPSVPRRAYGQVNLAVQPDGGD